MIRHLLLTLLTVALSGLAAAALAEPHARPLEAPGPEGPLRGTWLTPGRDAPQVLILPGSGPVDRDGFGPDGRGHATYRLLAEGLAAAGIASLRIDKRGAFASRAAGDGNAVTIADYARDTRAWVASLKEASGADCVWLAGHSEGGLVALAAAQEPAGICGLLLLAAPGKPLGQVLRDQFGGLSAYAPLLPELDAALTELEAGRKVDGDTLTPHLKPLFQPEVQDFVMDLLTYDPAALASTWTGPLLIVQGGRDLQVETGNAHLLHDASPQATLVFLEAVNHLFRPVAEGDVRANFATFRNPQLPLDPAAVAAIVAFVRRQGGEATSPPR